jgi:hypothetical protein
MNQSRKLICTLGVLVLIHGMVEAATSGSTRTYRWVDKNGVVHIGDSVPPEYAAQGQAELNSQGVAVRETPRQLSPEEQAASQRTAAETAARRQRDSFLLSTYAQVRDIEQLRDERLQLIDGQMELARGSMAATTARLSELQDRMRSFLPYSSAPNARRMPDLLAEEVVRALKEQRSLHAMLASREAEKNDVRAQFDADIARFRDLTSKPAR